MKKAIKAPATKKLTVKDLPLKAHRVMGGDAGDAAQLANSDLQNMLQKQQQVISLSATVQKALPDTSLAVIRKIG
jgi:hypothetical protein